MVGVTERRVSNHLDGNVYSYVCLRVDPMSNDETFVVTVATNWHQIGFPTLTPKLIHETCYLSIAA